MRTTLLVQTRVAKLMVSLVKVSKLPTSHVKILSSALSVIMCGKQRANYNKIVLC